MKHRMLILLLAAVLLTGCGTQTVQPRTAGPENAVETMLANPNAQSSTPALSAEQAKTIALEHAGLIENQVTYLRTEYEIDDGRPQYEVQFHQGQWEYHYEIDADNGNILSYDRDD